MKKVVVVPIEPIETRYTVEWYHNLVSEITTYRDYVGAEAEVIQIETPLVETKTSPGAFLDFGATNIYKSNQFVILADMIRTGKIKDDDVILYTDFWNPTVFQVKYMLDLLNIKAKIMGVCHAGNYDPHDFLGRIENSRWLVGVENAFFHAYDKLFFATEFHTKLFFEAYPKLITYMNKVVLTGQPHEYLMEEFGKLRGTPKENIVLFPHRISGEKQPEIFDGLANRCRDTGWQFIKAMDLNLDKKEYRKLLARSKIVFSASLQETLGIGSMEAVLVDAAPLVPDRLSYSEMYEPDFLYPEKWTSDWSSFVLNATALEDRLRNMMKYPTEPAVFDKQRKRLLKYLTANPMYREVLGV